MSHTWPRTPLAAAQRAFDLLTVPPKPLMFDGRGLPGLPQRLLGLDELKAFLLADTTPRPVRDVAWRELVGRARGEGPAWVIAAVGIAMPGLRRVAGWLAAGRCGTSVDADATLVEGFLRRLSTIDTDTERICGRLIDAGVRAVKLARAREETQDVTFVDAAWSLPPAAPFDHPDWVLARAVAAAVIAPEEQRLIAETRLGDTPLREVAEQLGVSVPLAVAHRRAAEQRLAAAIADGSLEWVSLTARQSRVTGQRRMNGLGVAGSAAIAGSAGGSGCTGRGVGPRGGRGWSVCGVPVPDVDQDDGGPWPRGCSI